MVNMNIEEERNLWEEEKNALGGTIKDLEKSLEDARSQNTLLHSQLATLGDQIEKIQSDKVEAAVASGVEGEGEPETETLRKQISELREVIRFMRSEKEMSQAQVDAARRTAEREKAAAAVTKRSLDEARAELKVLRSQQATARAEVSNDDRNKNLAEKLEASNEQLTLLRESNSLLREETDKLQALVTSLQSELADVKASVAPAEKKQKELEVDKAALEAEKASLSRELEAWKGRVHSLVSQFDQVRGSQCCSLVHSSFLFLSLTCICFP